MDQETHSIDIGDHAEVIVAGPPSLSKLWAFDGCYGQVLNTFPQKGETMATVNVGPAAGGRSGKQWFPTSMLRRIQQG